ncbi:adenosylcobinamide-GDP ribazoletransferase [Ferroplasma sp.]|uniref:adenosylcobinamide-GDP ribazoletransferase n=1 Tax=Ferroplasma sp. TaxID=2591003 RepID=UPI00307EB01A
MNKYIKGMASAFSFFTVIPLRGNYEINSYTMYYITFTGLAVGLIAAIPYYFISNYSSIAASAVAVSIIILLYGFNHFDSIMDFGDSVMVRGKEEKQRVIKDKYTGSGGTGLAFVVYITSIAFLTYFSPLEGFFTIISGEIVSKYATMISMYRSKPFGEGLGKIFIEKINKNAIILNIIPLILAFAFNLYNMAIAFIVIILAYLLKSTMEKHYGGINGDLIGSTGEISRLLFYIISFIFIALKLNLFLL